MNVIYNEHDEYVRHENHFNPKTPLLLITRN